MVLFIHKQHHGNNYFKFMIFSTISYTESFYKFPKEHLSTYQKTHISMSSIEFYDAEPEHCDMLISNALAVMSLRLFHLRADLDFVSLVQNQLLTNELISYFLDYLATSHIVIFFSPSLQNFVSSLPSIADDSDTKKL